MIEIVPNWHPLFVHFPLALLSVAVMFFLLAAIAPRHRWHGQWLTVARWNLWLGAGFAVITAITGWFAYNSVEHDTVSHLAMADHRNWAIATVAIFLALALWSAWCYYRSRPVDVAFLALAVIGLGVLASTGWRGGELVFRHGLGVMSLPGSGEHRHEHLHPDDKECSRAETGPHATTERPPPDGGSGSGTHEHKNGRRHRH